MNVFLGIPDSFSMCMCTFVWVTYACVSYIYRQVFVGSFAQVAQG